MPRGQRTVSKLQVLAISQLVLISSEVLFGLYWLIILPAEGGNGIEHSIANMLLIAFVIPAFLTMYSAAILAKPEAKVTAKDVRVARGMQLGLFILCILLVWPSLNLAFQGFVFFAVDCVLGLVLWPFVNKASKVLFDKKQKVELLETRT